jgi:hypothetical protein
MAKTKSSSNNKITFGKRKGGKASKCKGPKDKNKSTYRGQGKLI